MNIDLGGTGKVIVVVGGKGTGKTTLVRSFISKVHPQARMIYDVAGHYKDLYPYEILDFDIFKEKTKHISNAVVVYEESTIYFSNRGDDKELKNLLVKSRYMNNTIFLVYHSLRSIPVYILDLANFILLKKTNDSIKRVEQKFENDELISLFKIVKNHQDRYFTGSLELL